MNLRIAGIPASRRSLNQPMNRFLTRRTNRGMLVSILGCTFACVTAIGTGLPAHGDEWQPPIVTPARLVAQQEPASRSDRPMPAARPVPVPRAMPAPRRLPPTEVNSEPAVPGLPQEKPLGQVSLDIRVSSGSVPTNAGAARYDTETVVNHPDHREWGSLVYFHETPRFRHHPLYFEQPLLERGIDDRFGHVGPVLSGAKFLGDTIALPFQTGAVSPHALVSTPPRHSLGNPRGWNSLTPAERTRGAVFQTATVAGLILLIP